MQDHLAIVLESLRRLQAKVSFYSEPGNRDDRKAFKEVAAIIEEKGLTEAIRRLRSEEESPSVAPQNAGETEAKIR